MFYKFSALIILALTSSVNAAAISPARFARQASLVPLPDPVTPPLNTGPGPVVPLPDPLVPLPGPLAPLPGPLAPLPGPLAPLPDPVAPPFDPVAPPVPPALDG